MRPTPGVDAGDVGRMPVQFSMVSQTRPATNHSSGTFKAAAQSACNPATFQRV